MRVCHLEIFNFRDPPKPPGSQGPPSADPAYVQPFPYPAIPAPSPANNKKYSPLPNTPGSILAFPDALSPFLNAYWYSSIFHHPAKVQFLMMFTLYVPQLCPFTKLRRYKRKVKPLTFEYHLPVPKCLLLCASFNSHATL